MATFRQIYDEVCFHLWEDGGLVLGLLTDGQFTVLLNLAIAEFHRRTCLYDVIWTQTVFTGQGQYSFPTSPPVIMQRVDDAYLGGVYLEPSSAQALGNEIRNWRAEVGVPTRWHSDQLPVGVVELARIPNADSSYIPGAFEPDPPHAQSGSFNIVDQANQVETPDQHGGLTLIGPILPLELLLILDQDIPLLANDFAVSCLASGVLTRIYSGDNELKNVALAEYHQSIFDETVEILRRVSQEDDGQQ